MMFGVLGGFNVADFSFKQFDNDIVKDKLGFQLGMFMGVDFGRFAVIPQFLYVRNVMDVRGDGGKQHLRSNSIEVPILFSLKVLKPLRFNVGPVISAMNSCKFNDGQGLDVDFGRVRPTISYTIGGSLTLMQHFLVDVRYNGQFTSTDNMIAGSDRVYDLRSSTVAFSVGYLF